MNARVVRRILVALDASAPSHAALEEAAALAAGLQAELSGLFVLDAELLRLAALPVARETGLTSATRRSLNPAGMERALKAQAEAARAALEAAARRHRLHSTFRLSRGDVVSELIEAATQADLMAMGAIGHMSIAGKRLGSATRAVRARSRCSLLLLAPGLRLGGSVVVVADGTAGSARAVELADELSLSREADLVVLVCSAPDSREVIAAEIRERIGGRPKPPTFDEIDPDRFDTLRNLLRRHGCGLLVVGQDCELVTGHDDELCDLGCPVLLAGSGDGGEAPAEQG